MNRNMNRIYRSLPYNLQQIILQKIFIYVKNNQDNLLDQLNCYIKYSTYNIFYDEYRLRPIKKKDKYSKSFYKYFFEIRAKRIF